MINIHGEILSVDDAYKYIQELESGIVELKSVEEKAKTARKGLESQVIESKESVKAYMMEEGLAEIDGILVRYRIQAVKPKLIIDNESLIPEEYIENKIERVIRKDAITDQLKMGDSITGCRLEEAFALKPSLK